MKRLPLLFTALAITIGSTGLILAQPNRPSRDQMAVERDLVYANVADRALKLDLYLPRGIEASPPLIVWVHGGAWRAGSKDRCPILWLISEGYAVASINYRLSQEAPFPAQIHDCKAAIRWLRSRSARHGYSAERIGVAGASAGGHLVALLGTSGGVKPLEGRVGQAEKSSSDVQAVVDLFGPSNFLAMIGQPSEIDHAAPDSPESRLIGGPIEQHPGRVRGVNPITYVSEDDPPFLILHGSKDRIVPPSQSFLLNEALTAAGIETSLHFLEGAGHGGRRFFAEAQRDRMVHFFDRHIKQQD